MSFTYQNGKFGNSVLLFKHCAYMGSTVHTFTQFIHVIGKYSNNMLYFYLSLQSV
jgi:hypothetical protein